jgi:hypothetical protein
MKYVTKTIATVTLFLLAATFPALALDDTPENRAAQADYYLRAVPAQSLIDDMAQKLAARLPENQRAGFVALMTKNLNMNMVTEVMRAAMIKNFSADELKAIADFYGSPIGKSAMTKFGSYMADAMGPLQTEIARAMEITQEQMKAK